MIRMFTDSYPCSSVQPVFIRVLFYGTQMSPDDTDFHGFLSVFIRPTRVHPCAIQWDTDEHG